MPKSCSRPPQHQPIALSSTRTATSYFLPNRGADSMTCTPATYFEPFTLIDLPLCSTLLLFFILPRSSSLLYSSPWKMCSYPRGTLVTIIPQLRVSYRGFSVSSVQSTGRISLKCSWRARHQHDLQGPTRTESLTKMVTGICRFKLPGNQPEI